MNKTVLITGASSGFGRLTAKKFQTEGWNVIATMRSPEKETELTGLDNVFVTPMDVTDGDSVNTAIAEGIKKFGAIDVLVNNAGGGSRGYIDEASMEEVQAQFDLNVFGTIRTIQALVPHMRSRQSGVIINVTSISGFFGSHLNSLYTAAKFAIQGLTEALAFDMEQFGIKVKVVAPGAFKTGFTDAVVWNNGVKQLDLDGYRETYEVFMEGVRKRMSTQGGQVANPQDVADKIFVCATQETLITNPVGNDALQLVGVMKQKSEAEFYAMLKQLTVPDYSSS